MDNRVAALHVLVWRVGASSELLGRIRPVGCGGMEVADKWRAVVLCSFCVAVVSKFVRSILVVTSPVVDSGVRITLCFAFLCCSTEQACRPGPFYDLFFLLYSDLLTPPRPPRRRRPTSKSKVDCPTLRLVSASTEGWIWLTRHQK